jgi:hypothetical protein
MLCQVGSWREEPRKITGTPQMIDSLASSDIVISFFENEFTVLVFYLIS